MTADDAIANTHFKQFVTAVDRTR